MFEDSPIAELLKRFDQGAARSLFDRVEELRVRLIKIGVVICLVFGVTIVFAKDLFFELKQPLASALPTGADVLHFTSPLEVFMSYVKISFLVATIITLPFSLFQLWRYVGPALPGPQKRLVKPLFLSSLGLFLGGAAFCFLVILPAAMQFLIASGTDQATAIITVEDYVTLVVLMILGFGFVFQLPLVLIVLERLGIVTVEEFARNRIGILIGILVVAAVATPTPDPFSQLAMATPMYLLFEASLLVMRRLGAPTSALTTPTTP